MARESRESQAELFLMELARQASDGPVRGAVDLVNLEEAAERLSWRVLDAQVASWRARGRHKRPAIARFQAVLREVMTDIEVHTRGAAFRCDTPHGPLFNFDPLWEAAGQSGSHLTRTNDAHNDEPVWSADVARAAVA